ncbi:NAD-dependent epimerase [Candidatus Magnetaquicoccus inordinatus]|uniref:NAD-dependent epimerase n=1 Tax=Candidatus Magnetaquicoccus inordinatus TaxID=2496818 RepID=UPI00102B7934|nr:NAD-dependent epimerase [Candidatus Magnetaquicoccus inordinatus]
MKILVTGAAGFIGFHLTQRLLAQQDEVVGVDNLNDYYDLSLKQARLALLRKQAGFQFLPLDVADREGMERLFAEGHFDRVVHLAAQAGVRYSLQNPHAYIESNILGFLHVLEGCRHNGIAHLLYASSSSVYGANNQLPFSVQDRVDQPLSLYAASKRTNELMAYSYSHLYGLPATGLRFFTVYGPWGRPDMALFLFTRKILAGEPIPVFNYGRHQRDFTYIDDIIEGVVRVLQHPPQYSAPGLTQKESAETATTPRPPWRLYNIGNNQPVSLMVYIQTLEEVLGKKAQLQLLPLQPGDVPDTYADIEELEQLVGFRPSTTVREGIERFVAWYIDYYSNKIEM